MSRHPGIQALMKWLEPNPNLPVPQLKIARKVEGLASDVLSIIHEDDPELTAGLRKLLEAKDCFVRASLSS
jgi:hypothetical protein